ncbi:ABC transporter ATP-binding protein [Streptococcus salivarius]|jgi:putative ABC transport system ATP-binding protein|uniref:ABC transporter ATP-binding protein n=1 Tax=Streptococcus salivarius TaxID=1304 RepID=UPI00189A7AA9|nr:ABC transporter ATP-binding protein [Streptococcus salivarius]MDB8592204.1 ABC transporter ATP-binding protein [Streptococcus salivarius]
MSILTIDHISKYYNLDGTNQERALNDVTLEIAPGKITAIYGPSGCGKTSLLSIISGLDSQYQGNLYFKNQNMRDFSERDLTYFRKAHIGFVFQNFNLISHQSVLENVKMPLYVKNMTDKEMVEIAERELTRLGIGDFIKKNVKQLSGGQKQRVAIARALVNNPEMIVADEPTGFLDSQSQENVLEIFKELAEAGKTVIIVTHNPEVADYADVVIKMKDGEVVETIEK